MKRLVIWVVGEPGAGKTHIVRELLGRHPALLRSGALKWTVSADARTVAAGTYTGDPFDGADTIPYNGAKENLAFWRDAFHDKQVTILDGDRFSNMNVVEWVRQHEPAAELWVVHVDTPPEVAYARREARGGKQNVAWVKGRATKAANFYATATALRGVGGLRGPAMDACALEAFINSRLAAATDK